MKKADANLKLTNRRGQLKYLQLKQILIDQMASGDLKAGDMLAPEVDLAEQMGVARNTVRQALRELELQNRIRRVRGRGTIVCEVEPTKGRLAEAPTPVTGDLIGLVLPELRAGMYQSLQAGLNNSLSSVDANMIVCDSDQNLHQQVDALLQLAHRGVSGVAMVPITTAKTPPHHLTFLRRIGIPVVYCHRRVEGMPAPLIGFSPYDMGHVAGRELASFGHKRVAIIYSHSAESSAERTRGVRESLDDVGGTVPEEYIYYDKSIRADSLPAGIEERIADHLTQMLAHPDPPTAVVVSADRLAAIVCMTLEQAGVSVPRDMSVIGFGDRWSRSTALPWKLKSVTVDEWALGKITFDILSQLQRGERPLDDSEEIMMPLEISEGESIAPPAVPA